jgi:predicted TPR repeat methyltransferase
VAEYRLFPEGTIPDFTTTEFFEAHPWIAPGHQLGHQERTAMVSALIRQFVANHDVASLSDLGCGDGSLLTQISDLPIAAWGYDAGSANVAHAQRQGLDVRQADILAPGLDYGELITASEVVEHLVDPHGFIAGLPGRALILSSPSAEDGGWHYEHHSWAWDMDGYAALVAGAGWTIVQHIECDAPDNFHGGVQRPQRFQAIAAVK